MSNAIQRSVLTPQSSYSLLNRPLSRSDNLNNPIRLKVLESQRHIVIGYFVILFLVGLLTFPDYGISFDEHVSRTNGAVSLRYALEKLQLPLLSLDPVLAAQDIPLMQYRDRDYGVSFDLPALVIERIFSINDSRQQYLLRHFLTFAIFFAGVLSIYKVAARQFDDWRMGLLASTILITSPRIYGEAFYNNKDIVFMSLFAICLYTGSRMTSMLTWRSAVLHSLATAVTLTVRLPGLIFLVLTGFTLFILLIYKKISFKQCLILAFAYFISAAVISYALWPWLWESPIAHLLQAYRNMARFRWDNYNLYLGQFVSAKNLPWHYSVVWIAFTTPLLFAALAVLGFSRVAFQFISSPFQYLRNTNNLQSTLIAGIAVGPLVITGLLNSTLYDGWRQLYFVYPGIVLLAAIGAQLLLSKEFVGRAIVHLFTWVIVLQIGLNMVWMIRWHPYQYLYFNQLVSKPSQPDLEWDYWGVTNADLLRYVLRHDTRPTITIAPIGATSLVQSVGLLDSVERSRLNTDSGSAPPDYLITNYRFYDGSRFTGPPQNYKKFHSIFVDGREVSTIFKLMAN